MTNGADAEPAAPARSRHALVRVFWAGLGVLCVAVGSIGIIVPGLPTTVFIIAAAGCFARSSPRLERWLLGLPGVGRAVADYRAGLGMPRRAKIVAIALMLGFSTLAVFALDGLVLRSLLVAAALTGTVYVSFRVPTRERVLAELPDSEP